MAIGTATRIIKEGVSDDIFNNIIGMTDPEEMWEKLRTACSQVGQGVVYSILQELLNYPRNNKPKGFEKPVMSVFANVKFLIKRLRAAIIPTRDIWDSIAIVVTLDSHCTERKLHGERLNGRRDYTEGRLDGEGLHRRGITLHKGTTQLRDYGEGLYGEGLHGEGLYGKGLHRGGLHRGETTLHEEGTT